MVATGDNILGCVREPRFLSCNVPEFGIISIGPGALKMFSKQLGYPSLMKWPDAPLSPFNLIMVILMFNIPF